MDNRPHLKSGGQILVDCLIRYDVSKAFCVPGESYLPILDGLFERKGNIKLINSCHEAGASNMAEAYGKLTGRPGIAFVTRGPGACHASVGVHIAKQDSTPMILFIGQVPSHVLGREAFQEIDYISMFSKVAKWCDQIPDAESIENYLNKAFEIALSGRQGPVVLALPEDVLTKQVKSKNIQPIQIPKRIFSEDNLKSIKDFLSKANKPLILLGGSGWLWESRDGIKSFSENNAIPVVTSFRRQDRIDNRSKSFIGTLGTSVSPKLLVAFQEADLVLVIGARLSDMSTNHYQLFNQENTENKLIHIYPCENEINRVFKARIGLVADTNEVIKQLEGCFWFDRPKWLGWFERLQIEYLEDTTPSQTEDPLDLAKICNQLNDYLYKDSIITLDAGNHTGWPQRFVKFHKECLQIGTTCGSMGYSIPAAIAASLEFPKKQVISFVGDGGFLMSGLEISTAVQNGLGIIIIIFNNSSYGTIRMHQEFQYPNRVIGTDINPPNFVDLTRAMGGHAEKVYTTEDFFASFEYALQNRRLSLIEIVCPKDNISSRMNLEDIQNMHE